MHSSSVSGDCLVRISVQVVMLIMVLMSISQQRGMDLSVDLILGVLKRYASFKAGE